MDKRQIPENYFDQLPDTIEKGINAMKDNIELEAPLLYKFSKLESYKIPKGYFDTLYDSINISKNRPTLIRRILPYSIAASIIALFTLSWFWINQYDNILNNQLAIDEIYDYYIENESPVDQELLIELSFENLDIVVFDFENISDEELDFFTQEIIIEMTDQELLDIL